MEPMLSFKEVSIAFGPNGTRVQVLSRVNLEVRKGEFVCMVGPSGCGKTTLLKLGAGILKPQEGTVSVNGQPIESPSRQVGLIFQQHTLFPWLSTERSIEFALRGTNAEMRRQERRLRAHELIDAVGLAGFERARPAALSGGMIQRASLARALAAEPEALLLDEPFGALDMVSKMEMHEVLLEVWERYGMSILFVTHDVDEAVTLADRVAVMTKRPGTILEEFTLTLERPRIRKGIRTEGFEEIRNGVVRSASAVLFDE